MSKPTERTVKGLRDFAEKWNNTKSFPDLESLALELDSSAVTLKGKATRYVKTAGLNPELNLAPLVNRAAKDANDDANAPTDKLERVQADTKPVADFIVFSGAQPGANYNKNVFAALLQRVRYQEQFQSAQLLLGRIKYWKPYGWKSKLKEDTDKALVRRFKNFLPQDWAFGQPIEPEVHTDLRPYLVEGDVQVTKNLWFMTSMDILATARSPLTGLEPSADLTSYIYPHPKLALQFVPRSNQAKMPKAMMTTGAVTYPSYRQGKAGKMAARDHCFCAIVVEKLAGGRFVFRQLLANSAGAFHDVVPIRQKDGSIKMGVAKFTPNGWEFVDNVDTLVYGDWHCPLTSQRVRKVVFGKGGMVDSLSPKRQVFHDFVDAGSISHHDLDDPMRRADKYEKGHNRLEWEYGECIKEVEYIRNQSPKTEEFVFVAANHPEHVERFLKEGRYMDDPANYYIGHELVPWQRKGFPNPFAYYASQKISLERIKFLTRDDDYVRYGVKLDLHGDKGANGARASINHFGRLSLRCIIGHNHNGGIFGLTWSVGTSTPLKLDYTVGPTSWTNTHCVIYPGGQRQLLVIVDKDWHGQYK